MKYLTMFIGFCFITFFSASVLAKDGQFYTVKTSISVDGVEVMHPSAVVLENHPASIEITNLAGKSYRLEINVIPGDDKHNIDQATVRASFYDLAMGNWVLRAQPALVVWTGKPASVEQPYHEGQQSPRKVKVTVTVIPESKNQIINMFGKIPTVQACPKMSTSNSGNSLWTSISAGVIPASCCSAACRDGSHQKMYCCGAVSCSGCGASCSPP